MSPTAIFGGGSPQQNTARWLRGKVLSAAIFGGGCFWCTEAVFKNLKGVISVLPGYSGGAVVNPTYEQVASGKTGHAEVVKIEHNPEEIKFTDLLNVFFATHDPTTLNQQGNDVGRQYRSVIFYASDEQRQEAERFVRELEAAKTFADPILTELEPLDKFYPAEDCHQNYYARNLDKPYCRAVIDPKIAKLRQKFALLLKS